VEVPENDYREEQNSGDEKDDKGVKKPDSFEEAMQEEAVEERVEKEYCDVPFCSVKGKLAGLIEGNIELDYSIELSSSTT
jgi:hypothetical protein